MNRFTKTFVLLTVVIVLLFAFAGSVFAEPAAPGAENELTAIYSQDFEAFDASASADEIFSDARGNKPAGLIEFIGDGENSGAVISAGKVGGTKSLRLMRIDGGVADIRVGGINTRSLGEGSKLYFSFSFRYAVLGNYGFTSVLSGINASPALEDYGGETRNIFAVKTDMNTGKDSIFVVNPDGTADRILVYDGLKANTDYKLTAAFTIGSDEYEVLLNGESLGKYKYIGEMTSVTGLRIDCHDWAYECDVSRAQAGDVHVNEVYFDDISLTAVPEGAPVIDQDKTYKFVEYEEFFIEDWEDTEETDEYAKPAEEVAPFIYIGGMPFIKAFKTPFINQLSSVRVFSGSDAIDSVTLGVKDFADMRFWSITYPLEEDDAVYASVDLEVKNLTGYFDMCVTNVTGDEGATASTAQGGVVFRVTRSSTGKIVLIGTNSQEIAELEAGKTYNIGVVLTNGSDKYEFFIDGRHVSGSTCVYPEEFGGVTALRFDLDGAGSEVLIDNINLRTGYLKDAKATEAPTEVPATDAPTEVPVATDVPATDAATDAPVATDAPATEAATAAPATDAPVATEAATNGSGETDNKEGKGNKAVGWIIAGAVVAVAAIAAVCVAVAKKKKK